MKKIAKQKQMIGTGDSVQKPVEKFRIGIEKKRHDLVE